MFICMFIFVRAFLHAVYIETFLQFWLVKLTLVCLKKYLFRDIPVFITNLLLCYGAYDQRH